MLGFAVFWLVPAVAVLGLFLAGLGVSLLYPLTLTLGIAASGGRTDAVRGQRSAQGSQSRWLRSCSARSQTRRVSPAHTQSCRCCGGDVAYRPPHAARSFPSTRIQLAQFADALFRLRMRDEHCREAALVERVDDVERLGRIAPRTRSARSPARAEATHRRVRAATRRARPRNGRPRTHDAAKEEDARVPPRAGRLRT